MEHLLLCFLCRYHNVNINVAVQTEHGLFVPVVRVSDDFFLTLQIHTQPLLILTQPFIHNICRMQTRKASLQ